MSNKKIKIIIDIATSVLLIILSIVNMVKGNLIMSGILILCFDNLWTNIFLKEVRREIRNTKKANQQLTWIILNMQKRLDDLEEYVEEIENEQ